MNLIEHHIKEIHSVEDVTDEFEKRNGYPPRESLYKVDLTYNCYGDVRRELKFFSKTDFENAKEKMYFLA